MAKQYYYFIAGLPSISLDDTKLMYSPESFREDAKAQLSKEDYALLKLLHLPQDLLVLLDVLYKQEKDADPEALHDLEYWHTYRDYLIAKADNKTLPTPPMFIELPDFIQNIVIPALQLEDMPPRTELEHSLISAFFSFVVSHPNAFISQWFDLQRQIRNILTAINGRNHDLEYARYLIGDGDDVLQLSKSHAADFGLGKDHPVFDPIQRIWEQNNILYRERGYDIFQAKWIDQQNFFEYFNVDRILGYYSKLRLIHRWLQADAELGKEVFQDTLDKLENSFSFPEDFNIKIKQK